MKGLLSSLAFFLAAAVPVHAGTRIALVRVTEIYGGLPESAAITRDTETESKKILQDQRAEDVRKIIGELEELRVKLSDKKSNLSDEEKRKTARDFELKRQQAQTLKKEFDIFRAERQKEIDRAMVKRMRDALNRIWDTTRRVAKEQNYDLVIDSTGKTNTNLNFVLYAKKPDDITDTVVAALKDSAPAPAP